MCCGHKRDPHVTAGHRVDKPTRRVGITPHGRQLKVSLAEGLDKHVEHLKRGIAQR